MSKSKMIFDEIGTDVSGPVREAILSIDRLEKENAELRAAAKPAPEPKPSYIPPKKEETVKDDAED